MTNFNQQCELFRGHEDTITSSSHNLQHNCLPNQIAGTQCASQYDM